ncbi:MAG TPA: cupin domain-containing protein [Clostridia bacterium]|jgi:mannose-6-phosphate isomerase-like protein (cupin superfamily)|nr:cupin domain-containing protein [Clostridia bacterium]
MSDQLKDMGARLTALREIREFTPQQMAEKVEISVEEYLAYERGEKDFSFSFLNNVAGILGVDVSEIMSGQAPQLSRCALVKKGRGIHIKKNNAYDYKHLAYTFKDKKAEPFLVTVAPNDKPVNKAEFHAHEGQEFNYVVSGRMDFYIGDFFYELEKGDSVYFDSGLPHFFKAKGNKPAKFIAIVMK